MLTNCKIEQAKNTPLDYSDECIGVYFEFCGKKFIESKYLLDIIDFINDSQIIEVENGFNLFTCNQHFPEVIRILLRDNQVLYQIVRVN